MIEIVFKCDECESIYKEEVIDIDNEILSYIPDGWYIINEGTIEEKLLCQNCATDEIDDLDFF